MRPEVERPEPGENGISGKSELEGEFERAEVDREGERVEPGESAEITEMKDLQEISEQTAVATSADTNPDSGPE
jgi:hypothetical protein